MEKAGADAIELNVYYIPSDPTLSGSNVEQTYIDILRSVKATVDIPVSIKLSPFFSNMANMAERLDDAGANGLVLFNRFYQPDIDLEEFEVTPNVQLSTSQAMRLPMRWIAIFESDCGMVSPWELHPFRVLMSWMDVVFQGILPWLTNSIHSGSDNSYNSIRRCWFSFRIDECYNVFC